MVIKSGCTKFLAVSVITFLAASLSMAAEQGRIPPGIQKYNSQGSVEKTSREKIEIFTNDNPTTVIDFYRRNLHFSQDATGYFFVGWDALNPNRPSEADYRVGVKVLTGNNSQAPKDRDLFDYLKLDIITNGNHTEKELQQVKEKYSPLLDAWYPDYDPNKALSECRNSRSAVASAMSGNDSSSSTRHDEMAAKIEELVAQGRFQEAGQLGMQVKEEGTGASGEVQADGNRDNWAFWLGCLDEINRHAYQTRVEIGLVLGHFKPATDKQRKDYEGYAEEENRRNQKREAAKKDAPENMTGADLNEQMNEQMEQFKKMFTSPDIR